MSNDENTLVAGSSPAIRTNFQSRSWVMTVLTKQSGKNAKYK